MKNFVKKKKTSSLFAKILFERNLGIQDVTTMIINKVKLYDFLYNIYKLCSFHEMIFHCSSLFKHVHYDNIKYDAARVNFFYYHSLFEFKFECAR